MPFTLYRISTFFTLRGFEVKTFTATELRLESPKVMNEVQANGMAAIAHRDRPLMVIMTQAELDKIKSRK